METQGSEKKRVFLVETIAPEWIRYPKFHWPVRRFLVCHMDDATEKVEALSGIVSRDAALHFASGPAFELVDDASTIDFFDESLSDDDVDFTVEITQAVMHELDMAIVEVVRYGKNGLPAKTQLAGKFWIISLSGNEVKWVHATLRQAYARVSMEYEVVLLDRLIRSVRPTR